MDKEVFEKISTIHGTVEDPKKAVAAINKALNATFPDIGKLDVNDPVGAAKVKTQIIGVGDIDITVDAAKSYITVAFGGESAEGETVGMAFIGCLIKVVNTRALGAFFKAEPFPAKAKQKPNSGRSPARSDAMVRGY